MFLAAEVLFDLVSEIISSTLAQKPGMKKKPTICWIFTSTEFETDVFI